MNKENAKTEKMEMDKLVATLLVICSVWSADYGFIKDCSFNGRGRGAQAGALRGADAGAGSGENGDFKSDIWKDFRECTSQN